MIKMIAFWLMGLVTLIVVCGGGVALYRHILRLRKEHRDDVNADVQRVNDLLNNLRDKDKN